MTPPAVPTARPACFLDRDGTLMVDTGYPRDPAKVALLPGAATLIRAMNDARIPVVVVTNQSGIGRGLITEAQYQRVHARFAELLAAEGASLDGVEHCPHWPEREGPCDCRKPGLAMYRRAATALGLDTAHSVYIGDRWRDVSPALAFGGLGILVPSRTTPPDDRDVAHARAVLVPSLDDALAYALPTLISWRDAYDATLDAAGPS